MPAKCPCGSKKDWKIQSTLWMGDRFECPDCGNSHALEEGWGFQARKKGHWYQDGKAMCGASSWYNGALYASAYDQDKKFIGCGVCQKKLDERSGLAVTKHKKAN